MHSERAWGAASSRGCPILMHLDSDFAPKSAQSSYMGLMGPKFKVYAVRSTSEIDIIGIMDR